MSPEEREETLKQSCQQVLAWGWNIEPNTFLSADSWTCCPLGALIVVSFGSTEAIQKIYSSIKHNLNDRIVSALDTDINWCHDFWQGFDGAGDRGTQNQDAYVLGKKLRQEFVDAPRQKMEKIV